MAQQDLPLRTRRFALAIIALWRRLPRSKEYLDIGDQLRRAADSVAANYRAARCSRSRAEFTAKLGIVREEADESQHWLDELGDIGLKDDQLQDLCNEAA
jgi:four helix bundle protein